MIDENCAPGVLKVRDSSSARADCGNCRRECGQAMIMVAVVLPVVMLLLGLVVEGGNALNQYRRMQAAADMAALVGAQALPCSMSDTACIATAQSRACTYASKNGLSGCIAGGTSGASANVPPLSCSPYDAVNYGNSASNSNCKQTSAPMADYAYIEVHLVQTITIPILNVSIPLSVHAVARHGQVSPKRFAIIVLDPTMSKALTMSGSQGGGLVAVGPVISDSTASDSIYTGGSSTQVTCAGQWYTSANEVAPPAGPAAGLTSNSTGTTSFAPPVCTGGAIDSPTRFLTNSPVVPDPYSSSTLPTGNMSNCTPCNSLAWYYTWPTGNRMGGTWNTVDHLPNIGNSTNIELFPGIYPNGLTITGGNIFVNPGVYTMQSSVSQNGGNICIYGAPACDHLVNLLNPSATCSNASFQTQDAKYVGPGSWFYYCSPWGSWDSTNLPGRSVTVNAPTFTDGTPLNGVTFFMQSGNFTLNGNGSSYLAFPNPCPGTGVATGNSVPFPAGSPSTQYTYPAGSLAATDALTSGRTASAAGAVYPNADMSIGGECAVSQPPNARNAWTGELVGQHLHFLVFTRNTSTAISLNGTGLQNWWGIVYSPGSAGCGNGCQVSLNGSGGGGFGPPLLSGQIVADNASFSGSATFEVFYSPCRPDGDICSVGYGTSLVE